MVNTGIRIIQFNSITKSNFNNMNKVKLNFRKSVAVLVSAGLVTLFSVMTAFAQDTYKVDVSSKITIQGSSTIHDWSSETTEISGQAVVSTSGNVLTGLKKLEMTIPVESIKGDKSGMDAKTYEALRKDQYPDIKFDLDKVVSIDGKSVDASGKLTIAGVSREVSLNVDYTESGDKIIFTGEKAVKMTDFNVTPPTAMFGAIKSGDDITIKFDVAFTRSNNLSYK
jgi:polyisoprenoid-binding protein YceI